MKGIVFLFVVFVAMSLQIVRGAETPALIIVPVIFVIASIAIFAHPAADWREPFLVRDDLRDFPSR